MQFWVFAPGFYGPKQDDILWENKCSSALHSQQAVLLFCSQTLFIDWTHLLISSCHSHLLSRSLSIFFRPPIWHFSASFCLHPSPHTVCNSALFMPHLTRSCFLPSCLPSFPASLSKPTSAWPISLMTSSGILSHANNDNRNPVSLRFARGWISPERANRKINHCSWGLQKMVCQQTMMTVF